MQTQSHFLMTAALEKLGRAQIEIPKKAFLWGSVTPDLPLVGLSLGGYIYFRYLQQWTPSQTFRHMYDTLYFQDIGWITLHNWFHSPTMLLIQLALLKLFCSKNRAVFWFLMACVLHSLVDILTHVDDGPLLLFPFNLSWRFASPVSYWDPAHFGREFMVFETGLDLIILIYLLGPILIKGWSWALEQLSLGQTGQPEPIPIDPPSDLES